MTTKPLNSIQDAEEGKHIAIHSRTGSITQCDTLEEVYELAAQHAAEYDD